MKGSARRSLTLQLQGHFHAPMYYHNSNVSVSHKSIEQCLNISECVLSSLLFNPPGTPSSNVDTTSLPHSPLDTEGSLLPPIPPNQFSDDDTLQYPTLVENSEDSPPPPPIPPQQFSADDILLSPKLLKSGEPQQCEMDAPPPRPPKTHQEDAAPPPRPPKTNQEDAAPPPRPPKTNQEDAALPPRPPKTSQEDAPPPRPPKTNQEDAAPATSP